MLAAGQYPLPCFGANLVQDGAQLGAVRWDAMSISWGGPLAVRCLPLLYVTSHRSSPCENLKEGALLSTAQEQCHKIALNFRVFTGFRRLLSSAVSPNHHTF